MSRRKNFYVKKEITDATNKLNSTNPCFDDYRTSMLMINKQDTSRLTPELKNSLYKNDKYQKTIEAYLSSKLLIWKKRLGLSDWNITLEFMNATIMDESQGLCHIVSSIQSATIYIKKFKDRQTSKFTDNDLELDMLHELIHIRIWPFDDTDSKEMSNVELDCKEQAIEWIARALLTTDRKNNKNN